ncbi:adrenodoxin-like [Styela clava]
MSNTSLFHTMKLLNKFKDIRPICRRGKVMTATFSKTKLSNAPCVPFHTSTCLAEDKISLNFVDRKGETTVVKAAPYDTILDVVIDNDLDIESFGVCEGTLGCSTCHVVLEDKTFNFLEESCPPTAEEFDMLDLACGLTETSRLGCQVEITKDMEGCTIKVPKEAIDARDF